MQRHHQDATQKGGILVLGTWGIGNMPDQAQTPPPLSISQVITTLKM